jgi:hypothetical protein
MKKLLLTLSLLITSSALLSAREYYELRTYRLISEEKAKLFDDTMGPALVNALKSAGIGPIGIFKPQEQKEGETEILRHILMPFKSIEEWAGLSTKLRENGDVWQPAMEFLLTEKSDPAYTRIESSLLLAFEGWPELKAPAAPADKAGRHFELRTYESHSIIKGMLKVDMFNKGEIDIFNKVGLKGVFFAESKIAKNLPNLTYMLVYDSEEDKKKAWDAFKADPDWKALSTEEKYKDTVSKIHSSFLVATEYSQIQ